MQILTPLLLNFVVTLRESLIRNSMFLWALKRVPFADHGQCELQERGAGGLPKETKEYCLSEYSSSHCFGIYSQTYLYNNYNKQTNYIHM